MRRSAPVRTCPRYGREVRPWEGGRARSCTFLFGAQHAVVAAAYGDRARVEPFEQRHGVFTRGSDQVAELRHRHLIVRAQKTLDACMDRRDLRPAVELV